jgi:hypothetical protein
MAHLVGQINGTLGKAFELMRQPWSQEEGSKRDIINDISAMFSLALHTFPLSFQPSKKREELHFQVISSRQQGA